VVACFKSPVLDSLMDAARAQNFDGAAAVVRIGEADAAVRIAGAPLLPNLNATANVGDAQSGISGVNFASRCSGTFVSHSYDMGRKAAYEADFRGKNLATRRSAVASATQQNRDPRVEGERELSDASVRTASVTPATRCRQ
jgi:outer membrane protein, multidrug efflux system